MTSTINAPLEGFRTEFGKRIRLVLSGNADIETRRVPFADEPGLFGPDSATWEVHGDTSMLIGGVRALLLQTMHPLVMAGVADHSTYRSDPLGRLHRTGAFVGTTTFGTKADAEKIISVIRRVHENVNGNTPDGRPYSATDPHLLAWVHLTEIDSFLRARIRYGAAPVRADTPDRYVAEMAIIAEKLGVIDAPRSRAELRSQLQDFRPELEVGRQARDTVRFLAWPPLHLVSRPFYGLVFSAAVSMLPNFARRMLWLPVAPLAEPLAIRPATTALMRTLGWALGEHDEIGGAP